MDEDLFVKLAGLVFIVVVLLTMFACKALLPDDTFEFWLCGASGPHIRVEVLTCQYEVAPEIWVPMDSDAKYYDRER